MCVCVCVSWFISLPCHRPTHYGDGMAGVTTTDVAFLWLERLRLQASLFDMRDRGQERAERHLDELFFELVRMAGPELVIEVGAHDGQRAVRAKIENPEARVIALEGNPRHHQSFSATTDFGAQGVEYLHLAASDAVGPVTFHVMPDVHGVPAGGSSLLARSDHQATPVTVPGTPLDSFLSDAGSVALWVDVEGASKAVLAGAGEVLQRVDVMKIEVEERRFWEGQWLAVDVLAALLDVSLVPIARNRAYDERQYDVLLVSQRLMRAADVGDVVMPFLEQARVPVPEASFSRGLARRLLRGKRR